MDTILVVEDDVSLCSSIVLSLESAGFNTITAHSAADAENLFCNAKLVLLDVSLPDGNGFELCKRLRKNMPVPVIFITSYDEEADMIRGFDSGCDDYITKPFRLSILISRVRAVLRRCGSAAPMPELTAVEQKLLDYLMMNRGQFLTRQQILAYLWDSQGEFVNDNTLSVNISRLRDKLKDCGNGEIITKRGVGYKWTDSTN